MARGSDSGSGSDNGGGGGSSSSGGGVNRVGVPSFDAPSFDALDVPRGVVGERAAEDLRKDREGGGGERWAVAEYRE